MFEWCERKLVEETKEKIWTEKVRVPLLIDFSWKTQDL